MDFDKILHAFPPLEFAFAYGSGVFEQAGYEKQTTPPMVDFVFATADPLGWHRDNMRRNPGHYAGFMRFLGPPAVAAIQDDFGAGLYYNTLVDVPQSATLPAAPPGQQMKYGVISVATLLDDLLNWKSLYVSGRMHKPIRVLRRRDERIQAAQRENLRNAVRASLLMLPSTFTAEQLYLTIAGLSYTGDFRMVFGENPHKVSNIVAKSLPHFHALYAPVLAASFPNVVQVSGPRYIATSEEGGGVEAGSYAGAGSDAAAAAAFPAEGSVSSSFVRAVRYQQDVSPEAQLAVGMALPLSIQRRMAAAHAVEVAGEEGLALAGGTARRMLTRLLRRGSVGSGSTTSTGSDVLHTGNFVLPFASVAAAAAAASSSARGSTLASSTQQTPPPAASLAGGLQGEAKTVAQLSAAKPLVSASARLRRAMSPAVAPAAQAGGQGAASGLGLLAGAAKTAAADATAVTAGSTSPPTRGLLSLLAALPRLEAAAAPRGSAFPQLTRFRRALAAARSLPPHTSSINPGAIPIDMPRVVVLAVRGREVMARMRHQRLQYLVSAVTKRADTPAGAAGAMALGLDASLRWRGGLPSSLFKALLQRKNGGRSNGGNGTEGAAAAGATNAATASADAATAAAGGSLKEQVVLHMLDLENVPFSGSTAASGGTATAASASAAVTRGGGGSVAAYQAALSDPLLLRFWQDTLAGKASTPAVSLPLSSTPETTPASPPLPAPPLPLEGVLSSLASRATTLAGAPSKAGAGSPWSRSGSVIPLSARAELCTRYLRPAIAHVVGVRARSQSVKGIVTAGPVKSVVYVAQKLQKFFAALKK